MECNDVIIIYIVFAIAPRLKGRPKKAGRKRNPSLGSESNESETSSAGSRGSRVSDRVSRVLKHFANVLDKHTATNM